MTFTVMLQLEPKETFAKWQLACLFQRKSRAFVIARLSSLSSSCKNFNVAHDSKSMNTKLAHHDKLQVQDKGHNFESNSFRVMSLFN